MRKKTRFSLLILLFGLLMGLCPQFAFAQNVPEELNTIEGRAEDIIDKVPNKNWEGINQDVETISKAWKDYTSTEAARVVPNKLQDRMTASIKRLRGVSTAHSPSATMQAANKTSLYLLDIMDIYHPPIPTDVGRLDVFERQVMIDVSLGNFIGAERNFRQLVAIWQRLKPEVAARGGRTVARNFEVHLSVQEQAIRNKNRQTAIDQAQKGLDVVDDIEKVYAQ
jgi:hypothetical protein